MFGKLTAISNYFDNPLKNPLKQPQKDLQLTFLITFLGSQFIEGYRIHEKIGKKILIMSLMQYNFAENIQPKRFHKNITPQFRIIYLEMNDQNMNKSQLRRKVFQQIKIVFKEFQPSVEAIIVKLHSFRYTVLNEAELQRGQTPTFKKFYKAKQFLPLKNGKQMVGSQAQGTYLHALIETLIKGMGKPRNKYFFEQQITNNRKFFYKLQKVINTFYYIVGSETINNDYILISSQKWIRTRTIKEFKRPDLFLRNENKVKIIDWKFTNQHPQQVAKKFKYRSQMYYQLVRKDYNCQVDLQFYCIHKKQWGQNHHEFEKYLYQPIQQSIDLNEENNSIQSQMLEQLDKDQVDSFNHSEIQYQQQNQFMNLQPINNRQDQFNYVNLEQKKQQQQVSKQYIIIDD